MLDILNNKYISKKSLTISDLKMKINSLKHEIKGKKLRLAIIENSPKLAYNSRIIMSYPFKEENYSTPEERFLNLINEVTYEKWYVNITIVVDKDFIFKDIDLIGSGTDLNHIK